MDIKINPEKIDWTSDENYFFTHPQSLGQRKVFDIKFLEKVSFNSHLFIMTSGSKEQKCVTLSKEACLKSAQAVNQHLQVSAKDRWLVSLPLFHIGGLSILARCFLSQSLYFVWNQKWNPLSFVDQISKHQVTLTSLVPTQVYDLVKNSQKSPTCLRAVVVGGGRLDENLYLKARALGWSLLPSYGLTEVSSQVATAELESLKKNKYPSLKILKHCKVQIQEGRIVVQSSSLLSGWINLRGEWTPVQDTFVTEDGGYLEEGGFLKVEGRDRYVKIRGEGVSLNELDNILMDVKMNQDVKGEYILIATPHPRNGYQIDLVSTEKNLENVLHVREGFNQHVLGHEKIQNCYHVSQLPRGSLSKVQLSLLKKQLGFHI